MRLEMGPDEDIDGIKDSHQQTRHDNSDQKLTNGDNTYGTQKYSQTTGGNHYIQGASAENKKAITNE